MQNRSFVAGIHVLVSKGKRFLVLKRRDNDNDDPGMWDIPGGGIDEGEQPLDAAIREAKEEAGIEIKISKLLAAWAIWFHDQWSIELLAEGEYLGGELVLSEEHTEYKWVMRDELEALEPKSDNLKPVFTHPRNEKIS